MDSSSSSVLTQLPPDSGHAMSWSSPKASMPQKVVPQVASPPRLPASAAAAARAGKTRAEQIAHNANLYKTELCRSFSDTGYCRYGLKCQFAHGLADLRPVTRHKKYKTEKCKNFLRDGSCPYGPRCRFIHSSEESPDLSGESPSLSHIEGVTANHPSLPPSANTAALAPMSASMRSEPEMQQSAIFGFRNELEEDVVIDGKVVRRQIGKPHAIVTTATVPVGSPPSQSIAWQHALQIGDRRGPPSANAPVGIRTQSRDSDSNPSLSPNGVFSPSSASSGPSLHRATSATSPPLGTKGGPVASTAYPSGSISDAVRSGHYQPAAFDYDGHRDRRSVPSYAAVLADDQPRPPRGSDPHYGSAPVRYYSDSRVPSGERQYPPQDLAMMMNRMRLDPHHQEYGFPPHPSSQQLAYEQHISRKHAAQVAMRGGRMPSQYPEESDLRPLPSSSPPLPIQHPSRSAHFMGSSSNSGTAIYRSHSSDAYHGPAPPQVTHSHSYPYSMARGPLPSGSYQDRERAPNAHSLTSLPQLGGLYSDAHSTWGSLEDSHTSPTSFGPSQRMLGGASSEDIFADSPAVHPAHPSAVTSPVISASPLGPRSQSQSAFGVSKQLFGSSRPGIFGASSPLASASSMSPGSLSAASPLPVPPGVGIASNGAAAGFSHIILPPSNAQAQSLPNAALSLSLSVDPNAPPAASQRLPSLNALTSPASTVSGPDDGSQSDTTAHSGTRLHTNRSVASLSSVGASGAPSEHSEAADKEAEDENGLKRLPVFSQLCFEDMQLLALTQPQAQTQQL